MIITIVFSFITFVVGFILGTLIGYTLLNNDFLEAYERRT
jgi:ABC-type sulfate transport system permease component